MTSDSVCFLTSIAKDYFWNGDWGLGFAFTHHEIFLRFSNFPRS